LLDTYMQYLTDIVLCLEKHDVSIDTDLLFNTSDYSDMYMGIRALEGYLRLNDILSVAKSPKKIVILDTESQVLFSEVLQREISSNFGVSLGDLVHSDTNEICNPSDENNMQEQEDSTTSHSLILTDEELEDTDALELQCFQRLMSNFDENGMPIVDLDDDADDDIIRFEEYASEDWSPSMDAEDDELDDSIDEEDDDGWEEESNEGMAEYATEAEDDFEPEEDDDGWEEESEGTGEDVSEDDFEPEEDDGDWDEESSEGMDEYTAEAEDDFEPEEDDDDWEEESDEVGEDDFEPEEDDDDDWDEESDEDANNHITEPEDDFEPEEDDDDDWSEEDTSEATDVFEPEDDFEPEEDDEDDWSSGTDDLEENTSEDDFEPEEDDDDDWGSDNFASEDGFNSDEDDFEPEEDDDDDWGSEGQDVQTTDDTDWLEEDDDEDGDWDSPENINNSSDSFSNGLGNSNSCEPEDRNVGGTTRSILNWRSGNREWERTQRGSNPYEDYDSSQDTYVDPADFIDLDEDRLQETPQPNWVSRSSLNEDCSFGHDTYNNRGDTRANPEFSCEAGCSEQNFDEVLADNITNMADKAVKGLFKIGNSIKNKFRNSGNNGN